MCHNSLEQKICVKKTCKFCYVKGTGRTSPNISQYSFIPMATTIPENIITIRIPADRNKAKIFTSSQYVHEVVEMGNLLNQIRNDH